MNLDTEMAQREKGQSHGHAGEVQWEPMKNFLNNFRVHQKDSGYQQATDRWFSQFLCLPFVWLESSTFFLPSKGRMKQAIRGAGFEWEPYIKIQILEGIAVIHYLC